MQIRRSDSIVENISFRAPSSSTFRLFIQLVPENIFHLRDFASLSLMQKSF